MSAAQPGRPGNLTPEQEAHLKEFWLAVLEVFGVAPKSASTLAVPGQEPASANSSAATSPAIGSESPDPSKKKKSRLSWLGKHSDKDKSSEASSANGDDDKYGQNKEFKAALATMTPEQLRTAFWSMTKHDDPDALLLRFLRARKWDVHNALVMLVSTMQWRSQQMHVDDEIMLHGEAGWLQTANTASGTAQKDAADVLTQLRVGKSFIHGVDKEGRPMTIVRARTHHPGQETEKSLEQFTVFVIETARMLLRPPVDTATIIFDMSGFSMSNMDYTPVKFMIKCFEANYPESLGSVLVYKAPWIFQGIWKIIRGWLDPVVAGKVHFADDESSLVRYVDQSRVLKELGGPEDWTYKYIEPVPGENDGMRDTAARDAIQSERDGLVDSFEKATLAWARSGPGAPPDASGGAVGGVAQVGEQRSRTAVELRDNYWRLDPYIRARSVYDRMGILGPKGELEFYPVRKPSVAAAGAPVPATSVGANTAADDVD